METKLKRIIDRNNLVKQNVNRNNKKDNSIIKTRTFCHSEEETIEEPKKTIPILEKCTGL